MNTWHLEVLVSDDWREALEKELVPFAFGERAYGDLGADVIEVGPGPGLTTDLFRTELSRLTAIELDPDLADTLRERLEGTNVEVVEADATDMPFEDQRLTGAVCFTMLHHVPTAELQDELLAEVCRVLAPGGLLVASDTVGNDDLAAFHVDDVYNPVDPDGLAHRLRAAGFDEVDVRSNGSDWAAQARRPA